MFKTIKRIISWCGEFKGRLYAGFAFSFFSYWFTAAPVMVAAYVIGKLVMEEQGKGKFDHRWILWSFLFMLLFAGLRFLFDYIRARYQETISYELVARDRLAIGDALKRVSLGYFQEKDTGNILSSITTGITTLENMGIRMIDTFVGGYLNFLAILLSLAVIRPSIALIALLSAAGSFLALLLVSDHSKKNAPVEAQCNKELTAAALEYARGLPVVKSFGQSGAAAASMDEAVEKSREIHVKIENSFIPANAFHMLALKCGSFGIALASCYACLSGKLTFVPTLMLLFFSFHIFGSLEPISDSAHVLGIINNAMDQIDALKENNFIDEDGKEIALDQYDIEFQDVSFGYDDRQVIKKVSFQIPQTTSTAIVGPSGSGKTTLINLLARFYDVDEGKILIGGHNVKEFTCNSLLSNISMVFQNVYLFHDSIRANICFGRPDATEEEMIQAAKKACCHEFIMKLPNGYDTVIGEGGDTLSGGEKQRISIARAILKNAPVVILDEATASIDPENEHLIQNAITELTKGKTIITIAHRLATIEHADQILVVDDGKIIQKGTHKELIKEEGLYRRFIDARHRAEGWSIS